MTKLVNPILKGFYPDPSICTVDDNYYLVNSTFSYFPGVPIFKSKDLINWSQIGNVLTRESQLNLTNTKHSEGIFAPTIRYNNGKYYVITTNISRGGTFIVTANVPEGPWSDPYYIEGAEGIDPSLFFDDDGKAYYVGTRPNSDGCKYNGDWEIWLQEIDLESYKLIGNSRRLWKGALNGVIWPEGPHIYKRNDYYYLMIAEGGTANEHSISIARSKNIFGEYEGNPCNPILTHRHLGRDYKVKNVGHGDLVRTRDDKWFIVMLGSRYCEGYCNIGRETFIAKVKWENDWPIVNEGKGMLSDYDDLGMKEYKVEAKETCYHFDSNKLSDKFLVLRNPSDELYSLTKRPGYLRLYLKNIGLDELDNPAYVCVRQEDYNFLAATSMEFLPIDDGDSAGLAIVQDNKHNMRFIYTKESEILKIRLINTINGLDTIVADAEVEANLLRLKIVGNCQKLAFYYSIDGENYKELISNVNATTLSTDIAGGFVGCTIGLFAYTKNIKGKNYSDFLYFEYRNM